MNTVDIEDLFKRELSGLSAKEIKERFDEIMMIGMRVKDRMQVISAVSGISVVFASKVDDFTNAAVAGREGYRPDHIYYDDIPAAMEIEDTSWHRKKDDNLNTKKKTGFVGANDSHQNILNKQRRKKR